MNNWINDMAQRIVDRKRMFCESMIAFDKAQKLGYSGTWDLTKDVFDEIEKNKTDIIDAATLLDMSQKEMEQIVIRTLDAKDNNPKSLDEVVDCVVKTMSSSQDDGPDKRITPKNMDDMIDGDEAAKWYDKRDRAGRYAG